MNINEIGADIRLPDSEIECVRKYPFTFLANAALRGMKRRYETTLKNKTGMDVNMLYPTTLNQVIYDLLHRLYQEDGFLLSEADFESKIQYDNYISLITK